MKYILNHVNEGCGKSPLNDGTHVISCPLCVEILFIEKKNTSSLPGKVKRLKKIYLYFLFFQLRPVKSKFTGIDVY